jgi:hypothetical protein
MFSLQSGRMVWYDFYSVYFVIGDEVTILSFTDAPPAQTNTTFPTKNQNNRRILENIIDDLLVGYPQTSQNQGGSTNSSLSNNSGSSYSPADSNYLLIGYNYAYGIPFGFTIADSMFFKKSLMYISANFGFSTDPGRLEIEWIYGIALSINNWLRIPIGVGGNHFGRDGEKITGSWYDSSKIPSSGNYYGTDPLSEWEHAFVIEAGIQFVIVNRFYLSSTYRLKGFSKSGFTIGAGIIF